MNAEVNNNTGSGNWVAFLFGMVFNILSNFDFGSAISHAVEMFIGGFVCLLFKLFGDFLTPLLKAWWTKVKEWLKEWFRTP